MLGHNQILKQDHLITGPEAVGYIALCNSELILIECALFIPPVCGHYR